MDEAKHEKEMAENPFFTRYFSAPFPLPVVRRQVIFSMRFEDYFAEMESSAPRVVEA